jgi:hypothetical protein
MEKMERLASLLKRIDGGENPAQVAIREADFVKDITPLDIALAEQRIFEDDGDIDKLRRKIAKHMHVIDHPADTLRERLPAGHVLRRMLATHEMILCLMVDLQEINTAMGKLEEIHTTDAECRKFVHVVSHVSAAHEHFQLEEELLFPALSEAGLTALVEAFEKDHIELAQCTNELLELMYGCCTTDFKQFKNKLDEIVRWLVPFKREHIFMEDNLLYPIAYELIEDEAVWERLGTRCEAVGYCCFLGGQPLRV